MGILVAMIGMVSIHLVVGNSKTLVGLGDITSPPLILSMLGLCLIGTLVHHDVKGGILIGITCLTLFTWYVDGSAPSHYLEWPRLENSVSDYIDLRLAVDPEAIRTMLPAISSFVFIGERAKTKTI